MCFFVENFLTLFHYITIRNGQMTFVCFQVIEGPIYMNLTFYSAIGWEELLTNYDWSVYKKNIQCKNAKIRNGGLQSLQTIFIANYF